MKRRRGRLPRPLSRQCQPRGTFCHQRQKVPKERRQNPWFWIPCTGVVHPVQKLFCPANRTDEIPRCAFVSSLRLSPCKSACALALTCRNYNLHCTPCPFVGGGVPTPRLHAPLVTFRRGRCPHRPAQSSAAPLVLCHCEPVTDVTGCGNPSHPALPFFARQKREAPAPVPPWDPLYSIQASIPRLVRYFFTMRATLKVMASSNSRRSRPVSFLIFSRR